MIDILYCAIFWPHELYGVELDHRISVQYRNYEGQTFSVASSKNQSAIDGLIDSFEQLPADPPRNIFIEEYEYETDETDESMDD